MSDQALLVSPSTSFTSGVTMSWSEPYMGHLWGEAGQGRPLGTLRARKVWPGAAALTQSDPTRLKGVWSLSRSEPVQPRDM